MALSDYQYWKILWHTLPIHLDKWVFINWKAEQKQVPELTCQNFCLNDHFQKQINTKEHYKSESKIIDKKKNKEKGNYMLLTILWRESGRSWVRQSAESIAQFWSKRLFLPIENQFYCLWSKKKNKTMSRDIPGENRIRDRFQRFLRKIGTNCVSALFYY